VIAAGDFVKGEIYEINPRTGQTRHVESRVDASDGKRHLFGAEADLCMHPRRRGSSHWSATFIPPDRFQASFWLHSRNLLAVIGREASHQK
jgi:hypothetical protein